MNKILKYKIMILIILVQNQELFLILQKKILDKNLKQDYYKVVIYFK